MTKNALSPHYYISLNPKFLEARSDAGAAIRRAHEAVIYFASLDTDKAMIANVLGSQNSAFLEGTILRGGRPLSSC
jgi:hypothetical protein